MKKKKLTYYLDEFINLGKCRDEATLDGDSIANNKAFKKMEKIFMLAKDSDLIEREEFYINIFNSTDSPSTLIACCAQMLKLNKFSELAQEKLKEIQSNDGYHPLFRFNAKMFLEEWSKGNIKPSI